MKSEVEEREKHLVAEGETECGLHYLFVEVATPQNPPHLSIRRDT
jgi:hypothetical protein